MVDGIWRYDAIAVLELFLASKEGSLLGCVCTGSTLVPIGAEYPLLVDEKVDTSW